MKENTSGINVGDVVQLKHGGPVMSITRIATWNYGTDLEAECMWHDQHGKPIRATYYLEALRKPSKMVIRSHAFKSWFGMILGAVRKQD